MPASEMLSPSMLSLCPVMVVLCFPPQAGVQPEAVVSACAQTQQQLEDIWAQCGQKQVVSSHWWA